MRVVNFRHEIGDRELQLVSPQPTGLAGWGEAVAGAEKQQNIRRLSDDPFAGLEKGRREMRPLDRLAIEKLQERGHAGPVLLCAPRDIDIVGAGLFQRLAPELAPPLDRRPVVELDRKSAETGQSVSVRVDLGVRGILKKTNK